MWPARIERDPGASAHLPRHASTECRECTQCKPEAHFPANRGRGRGGGSRRRAAPCDVVTSWRGWPAVNGVVPPSPFSLGSRGSATRAGGAGRGSGARLIDYTVAGTPLRGREGYAATAALWHDPSMVCRPPASRHGGTLAQALAAPWRHLGGTLACHGSDLCMLRTRGARRELFCRVEYVRVCECVRACTRV